MSNEIDENTPPGTDIVCIREIKVGSLAGNPPRPTVGAYYTISQVTLASRGFGPQGVVIFLGELPPHITTIYGQPCRIGYDARDFRRLDKWVAKLAQTSNLFVRAEQGIDIDTLVDIT